MYRIKQQLEKKEKIVFRIEREREHLHTYPKSAQPKVLFVSEWVSVCVCVCVLFTIIFSFLFIFVRLYICGICGAAMTKVEMAAVKELSLGSLWTV